MSLLDAVNPWRMLEQYTTVCFLRSDDGGVWDTDEKWVSRLSEDAIERKRTVMDALKSAASAADNLHIQRFENNDALARLVRFVLERFGPTDKSVEPHHLQAIVEAVWPSRLTNAVRPPRSDQNGRWSRLPTFLTDLRQLTPGFSTCSDMEKMALWSQMATDEFFVEPLCTLLNYVPGRSVFRLEKIKPLACALAAMWDKRPDICPITNPEFSFAERDACPHDPAQQAVTKQPHLWDTARWQPHEQCADERAYGLHTLMQRYCPDDPHTPGMLLGAAMMRSFSGSWSWPPIVRHCIKSFVDKPDPSRGSFMLMPWDGALTKFQIYRLQAQEDIRLVLGPTLIEVLLRLVLSYLDLVRPAAFQIQDYIPPADQSTLRAASAFVARLRLLPPP